MSLNRRSFFGLLPFIGVAVKSKPPARPPSISGKLWRLPFQTYAGGQFRKYHPEDGSLGNGSVL